MTLPNNWRGSSTAVFRMLAYSMRVSGPLLPWIVIAMAFHALLVSGQGAVLASDFPRLQVPVWLAVASLVTSHLIVLVGGALAQIAAVARRQPTANVRPAEISSFRDIAVRGTWVAAVSSSFGIQLAVAIDSIAIRITVTVLTAASIGLLAWLILQERQTNSAGMKLLAIARAHRGRFALLTVVVSLVPLAVGALAVRQSPTSVATVSPLLLTLVGLSCVTTLAVCLLYIVPMCTKRPWLAVAVVVCLQLWGLTQPLDIDDENPLLAERRRQISERQAEAPSCPPPVRSYKDTIVGSFAPASAPSSVGGFSKTTYLISSEGGGVRAAYWTAMGLALLDDKMSGQLSDNVALLSGVSGGSLGVTAWIAAKEAAASTAERVELIDRFLGSDLLSPLVGGFLFLDVPRALLASAWFTARRDQVFEKAIAQTWEQVGHTDFFYRSLLRPCIAGFAAPPSLFFGATDMQTGDYAPLATTLIDSWPELGTPFSRFRLQDTTIAKISLAQAVHISARFPYLSPGAVVGFAGDGFSKTRELDLLTNPNAMHLSDTVGPKRVDRGDVLRIGELVDGGYYDNTGLLPVLGALNVVRELRLNLSSPVTQGAKATRFVSLHFSNDSSTACMSLPLGWEQLYSDKTVKFIGRLPTHRQCINEADIVESGFHAKYFQWLTTPLDAVLNVREGHSTRARTDFLLQAPELEPRLELSVRNELVEAFGYPLAPVSILQRPDPYRWATTTGPSFLEAQRVPANNVAQRGLITQDEANRLMIQWNAWDAEVRRQIKVVDCPADRSQLNVPLGWTLSQANRQLLRCLAQRAVLRTGLTVPEPPRGLFWFMSPERELMMLGANPTGSGPKTPTR